MANEWKELDGTRVLTEHVSGGAPFYRQWEITFTGVADSADIESGDNYDDICVSGTLGDAGDGEAAVEHASERRATLGGKFHCTAVFRSYYVR